MTADLVRQFLKRQPFQPFKIHLTDGRSLQVKHPDFLFLPPGWETTAIVALPKGMFDFVYIRNIASIESKGAIPSLPTRRRPRGESEE